MATSFFYSIKDLPKERLYALAYYFYRAAYEVQKADSFHRFEESQHLYNHLVHALKLEEHSKKVVAAVIKQHTKTKKLNIKKNQPADSHPYDYHGLLDVVYKEDKTVYDKCGSWDSETLEDINLIRAVFAPRDEAFANIIAYTFFYKSEKGEKKFKIPESISIPKKIVSHSLNTDFVKLFADSFKLSDEESRLLNIAYLFTTVKEFHEIFDYLEDDVFNSKIDLYSKCIDLTVRTTKSLLRRDRKLVAFDIMDNKGNITEDALDCLYSGDLNVFFYDVLKKDERKDTFKLKSFSVKDEESELALRFLKNNSTSNILLYGSPGAGKTEYARALAKEAGLTTYIFKNELETDDEYNDAEKHALNRLNSLLSLPKKDSVIIVDEAENLLSTRVSFFDLLVSGGSGSSKKGTVNKMLENSVNKVIWILNYTSPLDESTLRRFTYSIHFREMSCTMLRNIADSKLNKIKMSPELHEDLVELCGKYHVTGASVDNMVKTIQGMDLSKNHEAMVVSDVQKVLEANSTLLFGKKKMREMVRDSYELSILNTSTPAEKIVDMVLNAQDYAEKKETEENGIRMLFYGVSGTGKTELARYIAERLNKKICLKRVSDIQSKWVGESEQNIANAFAEAEASGDVLLFDEADSFFYNREGANASWERSLVNEFLTQMEEFSGILICTTNLRQIMDPAMQRRFHILSEFKPLNSQGIETLLTKFFTKYSFDENLKNKLIRYNSVTPGDFGTLTGKLRFMPASDISSEVIIDELCKIQEEKDCNNHRIGFGN